NFFAEHFNDPEVQDVVKKVKLVEEEGRSMPSIEVHTIDGNIYTTGEEKPDRSKYIPTKENMEKKFRDLCTDSFGEKGTNHIIDLIMKMEQLENIRELTTAIKVRKS
ncbi:MAG: hypothetical protein SVY10_10260, partial [Thermodesulfobacteriota bacterium]|nr:hypothetical protein [Thermodesulfobacteriota bacterium]